MLAFYLSASIHRMDRSEVNEYVVEEVKDQLRLDTTELVA